MNWVIFSIFIVFWWMQNNYFGWNAKPASDAELICDGITLLLMALAFK